MGSEDNAVQTNDLYLITEDDHKIQMTATALCIPDLVDATISEDTETEGIVFRLLDSYIASFTVELTNDSAKHIRRFCRRMKRYARRKIQQYKRRIAKEKKYGL